MREAVGVFRLAAPEREAVSGCEEGAVCRVEAAGGHRAVAGCGVAAADVGEKGVVVAGLGDVAVEGDCWCC